MEIMKKIQASFRHAVEKLKSVIGFNAEQHSEWFNDSVEQLKAKYTPYVTDAKTTGDIYDAQGNVIGSSNHTLQVITDQRDKWFNVAMQNQLRRVFNVGKVKVWNWVNKNQAGKITAPYWSHYFKYAYTTTVILVDISDETRQKIHRYFNNKSGNGSTYMKMYNYLTLMRRTVNPMFVTYNRTTNKFVKTTIAEILGEYELTVENSGYLYSIKHDALTAPVNGVFYLPIFSKNHASSLSYYLMHHEGNINTKIMIYNGWDANPFELSQLKKEMTVEEFNEYKDNLYAYIEYIAVDAASIMSQDSEGKWHYDVVEEVGRDAMDWIISQSDVAETQLASYYVEKLGSPKNAEELAGIIRRYFDFSVIGNNDELLVAEFKVLQELGMKPDYRFSLPRDYEEEEYILDLKLLGISAEEAIEKHKEMLLQVAVSDGSTPIEAYEYNYDDEYDYSDSIIITIDDEESDPLADDDDLEIVTIEEESFDVITNISAVAHKE